jgi:serine/threonine protein kinase
MGEVYKARDTRLDRLVALKVSKTEFSERFEGEARAVAALTALSGVHVGHVAIGAWIGQQPVATPEAIAPLYWDLHSKHGQVEKIFMLDTSN